MCWPCLKVPIETLPCESLDYLHIRQSEDPVPLIHNCLPVLVLSLHCIKVMSDAMFDGPNRDPVM